MKKFVLKYLSEVLFIVFLFGGIGFYIYVKYVEPYQIKQEVIPMESYLQIRLYTGWESRHQPNKYGQPTTKVNPYKLDEPFYVLTTKLGDKFESDYGTEADILKLKCQRYSEFEQSRKQYIADKEAEELVEEKKQQAQEDALDRLNEKSCN